MIHIGQYNTLTILRDTKVGLYLGNEEKDPSGEHDVLLPNKYVPQEFEIGEEIIVFIYYVCFGFCSVNEFYFWGRCFLSQRFCTGNGRFYQT